LSLLHPPSSALKDKTKVTAIEARSDDAMATCSLNELFQTGRKQQIMCDSSRQRHFGHRRQLRYLPLADRKLCAPASRRVRP